LDLGQLIRADQEAERRRLARERQRTEAACCSDSSRVLGALPKAVRNECAAQMIERV
jgi:hypothetical protein